MRRLKELLKPVAEETVECLGKFTVFKIFYVALPIINLLEACRRLVLRLNLPTEVGLFSFLCFYFKL